MFNRKTILYFATAFLLFAVDVGCTYTTFAVRGVPIEFEVNQVFRDWVIRDGWLLSIGKFTILKTLLFALAGWAMLAWRKTVFGKIFTITQDGLAENTANSCFWTSVTCHVVIKLDFLVTIHDPKNLKNQSCIHYKYI